MAKKAAVLFPEYLGDYLMLVPFLHELKSLFPDLTLHLYTHEKIFDLALHHPAVSSCFQIPPFRTRAEIFKFASEMRKEKYDIAYFTNEELFWVCFLGRVKIILKEHSNLLFRLFCKGTPNWVRRNNLRHTSERHINNLEFAFGKKIDRRNYNFSTGAPYLGLTVSDSLPKDGYVVLNPDAHSCKKYDASFFATVIDLLIQKGERVVLVGLQDPLRLLDDARIRNNVLSLIGKTNLIELMNVIAKSKFFIGIDSGTSHIACSVQTKSLILFPPKGASPHLTCGFFKENYSYKLPTVESRCNLYCHHYPTCPYDYCKHDYDWRRFASTLDNVMSLRERSWQEKWHETNMLSISCLILLGETATPAQRDYFLAMKNKGYSLQTLFFDEVAKWPIKSLMTYFKINKIQIVHVVAKKMPLNWKLLDAALRVSERWYMGFYCSNDISQEPETLFSRYIETLKSA